MDLDEKVKFFLSISFYVITFSLCFPFCFLDQLYLLAHICCLDQTRGLKPSI